LRPTFSGRVAQAAVSNNAARIARRAEKEVGDLPGFGKSPIKRCLILESIYLSPISSPRD
jgi:hypothetical protein